MRISDSVVAVVVTVVVEEEITSSPFSLSSRVTSSEEGNDVDDED